MDAKRYTGLALIGLILVLPFFTTGCFKKGEEDPFMSFRTRAARVVDEWVVGELKSEIKRVYDTVNTTITTTEVSGDSWKQKVSFPHSDSVHEYTGKVKNNKIEFKKNGKYTEIFEYEFSEDLSDEDSDESIIQITTEKEEVSGSWNFLSNAEDDYANKERLAMIIEERKTTISVSKLVTTEDSEAVPIPSIIRNESTSERYANGELSTIWKLISLRNKEIIMEQAVNQWHQTTVNGIAGTAYQEIGVERKTLKRD